MKQIGIGFSIPELQRTTFELWHTKVPIFLNNSEPLGWEVSSVSESTLNIVEKWQCIALKLI